MANNTNEDISQYNKDELHAPAWLNKEFLEMVLKQQQKCDYLKIESYKITPGTGKSDHYASVMFRAKINYDIKTGNDNEQKKISLIIKTTPEQEGMKMDLLQEFSLFKTEILMYSDILPKIYQILKSIGHSTQFYARMIYSSLQPRECIIFEDLVEKGFAVISKRNCTMDEVYEAITNLALMHAASYKLLQEGNSEIKKLNSAFTKKALEKFEFMQEGMASFKELLANEDDLKMYVSYVEKVEKNILDDVAECFDPINFRKRGGILVMTHGDFHSRNIMVQYEGDSLKNVMMVDFQVCFYGSAVLDLMYASVLLLSPEMRTKHREKIFLKYIEVFQETLRKLKFSGSIPTKSDFDEEWRRYRRWELFLITNYLVFSYTVAEGKIPMSDIVEKQEVRKEIWNDKKIIDEIRIHLPRMVKSGLFD